jgi:hypothetical protein
MLAQGGMGVGLAGRRQQPGDRSQFVGVKGAFYFDLVHGTEARSQWGL